MPCYADLKWKHTMLCYGTRYECYTMQRYAALMPCSAMLMMCKAHVVLCYAMLCYAMVCCCGATAILHCALLILYYAILCNATLCFANIVICNSILCYAMLFSELRFPFSTCSSDGKRLQLLGVAVTSPCETENIEEVQQEIGSAR